MSVSRRRSVASLVVLVAVLATYDVVRHDLIAQRWNTWTNVAMIAVVVAIALVARLSSGELGLTRAALGSGLRWGLGAFVAVTAVLLASLAVPSLRDAFVKGDVDGGAASMLWRTLVVIPIGTVALEELAFRGVMLGLWRRLLDDRRAVVACSVLFGLWHIPGVWDDGVGSVIGTVVATTIAGVVFVWLRLRSGSLLAPVLAHTATNSVAYALSWWTGR